MKICLYFFQNKHLIFIKEQPQEIYQDDEYPLDCSEVQLDPAWRSVGEQNQSEGRTFSFQVLQRNFLFKAYLISLELTFHVFLLFNKIVFVFLLQKNTKFFMKKYLKVTHLIFELSISGVKLEIKKIFSLFRPEESNVC